MEWIKGYRRNIEYVEGIKSRISAHHAHLCSNKSHESHILLEESDM